MRAAGEDLELGQRGRLFLLLVDRLGHARVGDEVELAADQQQRRAVRIVPADRRLVDDPVPIDLARRRHDVAIVERVRLVLRHQLGEAVAEEAARHGLGLLPAAPVEEHRQRRHDRMRPERDAGRRRRVDRHAGDPEAAVEQMLDEHAAGRMADQDRFLRALADDAAVMVEDLGDAEAGELLVRLRAQFLGRAVVIGPVGRDDGEALRLVTRLDRVPAARIEPGAVDEQDGVGHFEPPGLRVDANSCSLGLTISKCRSNIAGMPNAPAKRSFWKNPLTWVMAVLFLICAGWFLYLYNVGVQKDSLDMEFAKALLQVGVVSVTATLLSLLVFDHQQRRNDDQRERERREENRIRAAETRKNDQRFREDFLKGTLARITTSYNGTKRARRKMRAMGLSHEPGRTWVDLARYDECMADVSDAQLELETIKGDVRTSAGAYPSAAQLAPQLKSMEQYLGELVEEYETVRSRAGDGDTATALSKLPRFADFVGPSGGSNFEKRYSDAHSAARSAIRGDLQSVSSLSD